MAYLSTIDERYGGGLISQNAGVYDASNLLNDVFTLAEGVTGYGFSTDAYTFGDSDVYSLGILAPGAYSVDVDSYTWDFFELGFGSIASFHVLNNVGSIVTVIAFQRIFTFRTVQFVRIFTTRCIFYFTH